LFISLIYLYVPNKMKSTFLDLKCEVEGILININQGKVRFGCCKNPKQMLLKCFKYFET